MCLIATYDDGSEGYHFAESLKFAISQALECTEARITSIRYATQEEIDQFLKLVGSIV